MAYTFITHIPFQNKCSLTTGFFILIWFDLISSFFKIYVNTNEQTSMNVLQNVFA